MVCDAHAPPARPRPSHLSHALADEPQAHRRPAAAPSDHPYYDEIAVARTLFLQGRSDVLQGRNEHPLAKEREARERAKLYRSHDPRRFRIAPA